MTISLKAYRDTATEIGEAVGVLLEGVESKVAAGTATDTDYAHLIAELTGYEADIKALRKDLDATDVASEMVFQRGDLIIELWRWERQLRHDLVSLAGAVRRTIVVAEQLRTGEDQRVYVSRSGDTLQKIAQKTLGDWREWPRLLDANPDISPGEVASGTLITIPKKR